MIMLHAWIGSEMMLWKAMTSVFTAYLNLSPGDWYYVYVIVWLQCINTTAHPQINWVSQLSWYVMICNEYYLWQNVYITNIHSSKYNDII